MRSYRLLFALLLFCTAAGAQNPRHQARVEERDARRQTDIRAMDSVILSQHYCFTPTTMEVEPAGNLRNIYNAQYNITVDGGEDIDICIPWFAGIMPPYHLRVLNYIATNASGYLAVRNDDGWNISFSATAPDGISRNFAFTIYPVTGDATLNLTSDEGVTVSYSGTLQGIY